MATRNHNLSDYDISTVPSACGMKIGIVVSEWNADVTGALMHGAVQTLKKHGVADADIHIETVPGSFELIHGSMLMAQTEVDAVIAIGCVIRGDTPHFDYICQGTTQGLAQLNLGKTPVIYGLITTNNMEQALERCGGKLGNKGDECAVTEIKMIALLMYVCLIMLDNIPAIQTIIGSWAADVLSKQIHTSVGIGRIDLGLLNRLIIDDINIDDQAGDTLMKADRMALKLEILPLFKGTIRITNTQIFGLTAHTQHTRRKTQLPIHCRRTVRQHQPVRTTAN